ncbi:MAG TPA: hypothetical protein VL172_04015, partial [Kofleriaceae bacterium]|nr:hypothetical protein [Kofleriaceae bacterium]
RDDAGDISSQLTSADGQTMIGELRWDALAMRVDASLAEAPLPFTAPADLGAAELGDLNLFLYALWEVERDAPAGSTCVESSIAICCHADAWSCATRVE